MNKSELIKKLEDIEWEDFEVKEAKSEISNYGLKPVIEGDFDCYKITFPVVAEKVPKKLGIKVGEKLGVKLGEKEIKIIELMRENKYITTKELSGHIKISTTAVDNNISKLKKKGLLRRIGPAKGGHWEIIKK